MLRLDWTPLTAFKLTNRISIPAVAMSALMQVSPKFSDSRAISSAYVCALSFCAHKRNVSVSLNQLSSTILQTAHGTLIDWSPNALWLSFTGEDINMTYPSNLDDLEGKNDICSAWFFSLQHLVNTFTGNETVYSSGVISFSSSIAMAALTESLNIPIAMNNFAIAMTNYFRDSSNTTVVGQVGRSEVYIHVNWPWITLPALLVAAGTAFLILAMLETKRRGGRVWKTSELALLFHGLGDAEQEFAAINKVSAMERVADGVRVRMANADGRGWILRREKAAMKVM